MHNDDSKLHLMIFLILSDIKFDINCEICRLFLMKYILFYIAFTFVPDQISLLYFISNFVCIIQKANTLIHLLEIQYILLLVHFVIATVVSIYSGYYIYNVRNYN